MLAHLFQRGDVGPAETVDGLLGVTHKKQFARRRGDFPPVLRLPVSSGNTCRLFGVARQEKRDFRLYRVSVLQLVNQDVVEPALEVLPGLGIVPQQGPGPHQQVLELGSSPGFALRRQADDKTPQGFQQRRQRRLAQLLQVLRACVVQTV